MAQKAIREYHAKKIVYAFLPEFWPEFTQEYDGQLVSTLDNKSKHSFVNNTRKHEAGYVVKPDELFGKRGKNKLVYIAETKNDVVKWINQKAEKPVTIEQNGKKITGILNHFIVEPFIAHEEEYYIAIKTNRDYDSLFFSMNGGVDVEENWKEVTEVRIPFVLSNTEIQDSILEPITKLLQSDPNAEAVRRFITALYQTFKMLNFTYLEINPFVFKDNDLYILDLVSRLDDTASYQNQSLWAKAGDIDFPNPFGSTLKESEASIASLDLKSGASLKFRIINPKGRIWLLTSGGGGSVVFADTIGDLGYHQEIANYSDYSGNPNSDETQEFCENIFTEMFKSPTKNKILIVAGGIANFTDIAKTFIGVSKAITNYQEEFRKQKIKVFVRRGGPNYLQGLERMRLLGIELDIPIDVHGPETYMTEVTKLAVDSL